MRGICLLCALIVLTPAAVGEKNAAADHRVHPSTTSRDTVRTAAEAVARVKAACTALHHTATWRAELHGRRWSAFMLAPSGDERRCISAGGDVDSRSGKVTCFTCIR